MNILFFILLVPLNSMDSISVESGTLINKNKEQVEVGRGTYIPWPSDKILAKKILDKNLLIKELQIDLDLSNKHRETEKLSSQKREKEITDYHRSRYRELKIENESMRNWWNTWGRTLLVSVISVGVAGTVTYFVIPK